MRWLVAALVVAGCSAPQATNTKATGSQVVAYIPTAADPTCRVLRIVDGDTVSLACSRDAPVSARLVGYDTPESYRPGCNEELVAAKVASRHLEQVLRQASVILPEFEGTDRYGRALVTLHVDGRDLADIMVSTGLAVHYDGGKRIDWCRKLRSR